MKNKAKTKIISTKTFKSAVFFTAVIAFCVLYYFISPYFISEKPQFDGAFPIVVYGEEKTDLEVHYIDVGQADSVLIKTPDFRYVLIDSGDTDDFYGEKLVSYLKNIGVKTIDYAVATHSDADHIGGFKRICDNFKVKFFFRPYVKSSNVKSDYLKERFNPPKAYYCDTDAYADFLIGMKKERANWAFTTKDTDFIFDYGQNKLVFDFLTPIDDISKQKYSDMNEYSPLLKVSYGKFSFMFTADAPSKTEKTAMDYYDVRTMSCKVLKIGHHGSDTSTSFKFLKATTPDFAVISCGDGSIYNHPKQTVLTNLLSLNIKVYRTDKQGNIVFKVNADGKTSIKTEKNYQGSLYTGY